MGPTSLQPPIDMGFGYEGLCDLRTEPEIGHRIIAMIRVRIVGIEAEDGSTEWMPAWLFDPLGRNKAKAAKIKQQKAHVTLMIYLVRYQDPDHPPRPECTKLLQHYKTASRKSAWDKNRALLINALEKAVQRVYALKEPAEATFADVFVIRNIYDDPDLKAVIPECFTSGERLELAKVMREALLHQPEFPPPCWALTKDLPYVGKVEAG
ncbi:hypothetical protein FRC00_009067 [Tulasnella sp. 408]|nr:hypothetical protein FRC00_009067 [Tulasnella sp. 408]